ncbi:5-formyltetrahydrofolate cyclo-ligase [Polynucleobacter sp. AP-Melu-500A-A1]|uniref:5-formyltetrahydrofolate cyclo-ligase n=1 Tax=Polynucleobacter sp. AP-Melu-500A-A1 TaxID=2576929 RepID=UPI001C20D1BD|nr:5-formyltetrahydrofolate cyclo-ligase [Polynucleobacter sp. AP-Melu-500A-A1]
MDMHGNSLKTLRQDLLRRRKEFTAEKTHAPTSEHLIAKLNEFLAEAGSSLQSIALYWPIQDEVDLRLSLLAWAKSDTGRQLALPFARPDKHLEFFQWQEGDHLTPSQHGVPEPDPKNSQRLAITPDCILIPCVGWSSTSDGSNTRYWRLGYGGGYFDRTLAQLRKNKPSLICIGIGFDWQKLDDAQWSAQTHDEPLDILITESGVFR